MSKDYTFLRVDKEGIEKMLAYGIDIDKYLYEKEDNEYYYHEFEDFNDETQEDMLRCQDINYLNFLPTYDNVDELFKSMIDE